MPDDQQRSMNTADAAAIPPPMLNRPSPSLPDALRRPAVDRFDSVDTLRGFALLGILTMNIIAFGLPGISYMNPASELTAQYAGPFEGANKAVWWATQLLADQRFMSIFSMLFGAGLVLMGIKGADQTPAGAPRAAPRFAGLYYRRLLWLALFGLVHAYLIWFGDILFSYALCGLVLYPLRRLRPVWLITMALGLLMVLSLINLGMHSIFDFLRSGAQNAQEAAAAGGALTSEQTEIIRAWEETSKGMNQTADMVNEEVANYRGSILSVLKQNAISSIFMQTFLFAIFTFWRCTSMMLLGMALMKLGVFAAQRSRGAYATMMLVGYGLGLPTAYFGGLELIERKFDMTYIFGLGGPIGVAASVLVAIGHVGAVMLVCRLGLMRWLTSCLAAVGRMGLTNYLMQSVLCTSFFYGWGLSYFGRLERAELYGVVLAVWVLQLLWSPIWLKHFHMGPAEWLWRSLTYWQRQPFRRRGPTAEIPG